MTKRLREIQTQFQQWLIAPSSDTPSWVVSDTLPAQQRMVIYEEAYRLRLIETLKNDYLVTAHVMGDALFRKTALAYIAAYPSHSYSLRFFGKAFSAFLNDQQNLLFAELAKFEWALTDVFDAPDDTLLTRDELTTLSMDAWEKLVLKLHPGVCTLTLSSNAPAVWQAFKKTSSSPVLKQENTSTHWLVWRHKLKNYFRSLSALEFKLLSQLENGCAWHNLCIEVASTTTDHAAQTAATFLNTWVNDGLLIHYSSSTCMD